MILSIHRQKQIQKMLKKYIMKRKPSNSCVYFSSSESDENATKREFQKMKLQKVNRNKYSTQLVNLEIDHTKTPVKNSNDKSEKYTNKSNESLDDIKQILRDCKNMCLNFHKDIETIEQLLNKEEDEERLIMESIGKIVMLRTMLKEKDLTIYYQALRNRRKSATKRYKVSDDKQSSEECDKGKETPQKNTRSKLSLWASSSSESVQSETNVSKKRRLENNENHHCKDKKLRMSCKVNLIRLSADVLKCYSRMLRTSRESEMISSGKFPGWYSKGIKCLT